MDQYNQPVIKLRTPSLKNRWDDVVESVLNFSVAERSSVGVTGSRERSPGRTTLSPQHTGYPSWARVEMSEDLRDFIR